MTTYEITQAVEQLARSERGRTTLHVLHKWLNEVGFGLDGVNQLAVQTVVRAAWDFPLVTLDAIEVAIGPTETDQ